MKNKSTKATCRRGISLLAAAALTAALMSGQVYGVFAENTEKTTEINTLFPDNITISEPVALSEVSLPKNEYGTLSWADETYVPSQRVQSCEVFLKPFKDVDLSDRKEWDSKKEVVVGYVTVVVSSIEEASSDVSDEDSVEYTEEQNLETTSEETTSEENRTQEPEETEIQNTVENLNTDNKEGEISQEETVSENSESTESNSENPAAEEQQSNILDDKNQIEESNTPEDAQEKPSDMEETSGETVPDTQDDSTVTPEAGEGSPEIPSENPENIFDRADIQEDNRPTEAQEDLSEKEIIQFGEINHNCDGIYVSGIDLPWYVQFRATSGESYEFSNETEASIFKSYEFELWDLRNDTEYEIPDGEYISVTIPVKAGYEYTVEHILDNGATETIIPSVTGDVMVFSTHSFSPFGIAGSKPILYPEIAEDGYDGTTPAPTVTPTKPAVPTSAPSQNTLTTVPTKSASATGGNTGNTGSSPNTVSGSNNGTDTNKKTAENTVSSKDTNGRNVVNTGDYTRILPFVVLIAAAVVIIIAAVVFLKKRK